MGVNDAKERKNPSFLPSQDVNSSLVNINNHWIPMTDQNFISIKQLRYYHFRTLCESGNLPYYLVIFSIDIELNQSKKSWCVIQDISICISIAIVCMILVMTGDKVDECDKLCPCLRLTFQAGLKIQSHELRQSQWPELNLLRIWLRILEIN